METFRVKVPHSAQNSIEINELLLWYGVQSPVIGYLEPLKSFFLHRAGTGWWFHNAKFCSPTQKICLFSLLLPVLGRVPNLVLKYTRIP